MLSLCPLSPAFWRKNGSIFTSTTTRVHRMSRRLSGQPSGSRDHKQNYKQPFWETQPILMEIPVLMFTRILWFLLENRIQRDLTGLSHQIPRGRMKLKLLKDTLANQTVFVCTNNSWVNAEMSASPSINFVSFQLELEVQFRNPVI